jgi:hypothetical protein
MAFWKIVGFDVTPRTPLSTQPCMVPSTIQSRRTLSSQGL